MVHVNRAWALVKHGTAAGAGGLSTGTSNLRTQGARRVCPPHTSAARARQSPNPAQPLLTASRRMAYDDRQQDEEPCRLHG